jgi:dipeptidyl aminopeptidase/acylaminoacyl peptidase
MSIDPIDYARDVRCPALILQGGTDLIVPQRSAERIASAMRADGDDDVSVRFLPNVSHAFLPDTNGLNSQWPLLPAFVTSPDVLDLLSTWMSAHLAGT